MNISVMKDETCKSIFIEVWDETFITSTLIMITKAHFDNLSIRNYARSSYLFNSLFWYFLT